MSEVPSSYFIVQSRIPKIMDAIRGAGVPDKFTLQFLDSLGFKSTNDRPIVAMLKSLGFLDQNGIPTNLYKSYKDTSRSKKVLAEGIRKAYTGIFAVYENAHKLSFSELKGKFASVTGKGDAVVEKMAQTFKSFCNLADFDGVIKHEEIKKTDDSLEKQPEIVRGNEENGKIKGKADFHYNIQIHLPVSRDISVYNAIFKSLKDHLF